MDNLVFRFIYSALTLYMLMIMMRWLGPWLGVDVEAGRLKVIPRLTDPVIGRVRSIMPKLGPVDMAPLATLVAAWFLRVLLVGG